MQARAAASRIAALVAGPRLQVVNLATLYAVVLATVDYPNPVLRVAASVAVAGLLDAAATRVHWGTWRVPWGTVIGTMGIWLMLDGHGWLPFLALPAILVGSKHLVRWGDGHLFNANNLAAALLIVAGTVRVGVNEWGAAPQTVALMLLFGTVATLRAKRFLVAVSYLACNAAVYGAIAAWQGQPGEVWFIWAFAPIQVMEGLFAVTDPATTPRHWRAQVAYAVLASLLTVPAMMAGRPDAPVFGLLVAAPQRHLVESWFSQPSPESRPAPAAQAARAEGPQ